MPEFTPRSLRRALLLGSSSAVLLLGLAGAISGYQDARHEIAELFDARLAQSARVLSPLLEHQRLELQGAQLYPDWEALYPDAEELDNELTRYGHHYERKLIFQLLDAEGRLVLRSPNAPAQPLTQLSQGYTQVQQAGSTWRLFVLPQDDGARLINAERLEIRNELVNKIAWSPILRSLMLLPLLLGLLWLITYWLLRPLQWLQHTLASRAPDNLAPLPRRPLPEELRPLCTTLDQLLSALKSALERERQLTDEAAHELRTPLSVLRIHAENALHSDDPDKAHQSLQKLLAGLDRSERLITQLLTLARLDHRQVLDDTAPLDLAVLAREVVAELAPLALKRDQELGYSGPPQLVLKGQPTLLRLLLTNLIDNALRYSPDATQIQIVLEHSDHSALVSVQDQGPGLSDEERHQLCRRFWRSAHAKAPGAGLGMAIVERILLLHGGRLAVWNRAEGGLEVQVRLPLGT